MNDSKITKKERASNLIIENKENALELGKLLKEPELMKINLKETNINKQIKKVYTFFKPEIESKGLAFFFKNSLPTKDAIFLTDPKKIYTVLVHLIKNVIRNTHEGSIEFGYGGKTTTTRRTELMFFVKHTGGEVLKAPKKEISERFVQNKVTQQENGLGLALSKLYVTLLGGKIWAESDESKVAKFYFTLPYRIDLKEKLLQEIPQC